MLCRNTYRCKQWNGERWFQVMDAWSGGDTEDGMEGE